MNAERERDGQKQKEADADQTFGFFIVQRKLEITSALIPMCGSVLSTFKYPDSFFNES